MSVLFCQATIYLAKPFCQIAFPNNHWDILSYLRSVRVLKIYKMENIRVLNFSQFIYTTSTGHGFLYPLLSLNVSITVNPWLPMKISALNQSHLTKNSPTLPNIHTIQYSHFYIFISNQFYLNHFNHSKSTKQTNWRWNCV